MSVISTIDLRGGFQSPRRFLEIIRFLEKIDAKISFDNYLHVSVNTDDDWEYDQIAIPPGSDPFDLAENFFISNEKNGLYFSLPFSDRKDQYIMISSWDANSLSFLLAGNRVVIDKRYTNFTWYYENLISKIDQDLFRVESVVYEDVL